MKYSLDIDTTQDDEWIYTEYSGCINAGDAFDMIVNIINALDDFESGRGDELNIRVTKFEEKE